MRAVRITERVTKRESGSFKQYLNEIADIKMFTPDEEAECSKKSELGDKNATDELVKRNLRFVVSVAKQYETATVSLEDLVNEGNIGLIMAAKEYKVSTGFKFISYAVYWIRKMILEFLAKNGRTVRLPSNKINAVSKLNQHVDKLEQKYGRSIDFSEVIDEYGTNFNEGEIQELQSIAMLSFESLDTVVNENSNSLYDIIADDSINPSDYLVTNQDIKNQVGFILNSLKPRDRLIMINLYGLDGNTPATLKEVSEQVGLTREMVRQIREKSIKKLKNIYVK